MLTSPFKTDTLLALTFHFLEIELFLLIKRTSQLLAFLSSLSFSLMQLVEFRILGLLCKYSIELCLHM